MSKAIVPFFISHRGCLHRCVFCDQEKISGVAEGMPTGPEIVARVEAYRAQAGNEPVEVAFYGGSFCALPALDQDNLLQPLQPLIASGAVSSVRVSTRPDTVDPGTAAFLAGMGVGTVELGVQSMDDGVLYRSARGHDSACVATACLALRGEGLEVGMQLMPGLPGDSGELALASLDRVLALFPDFIRIYPTVVIAGTVLARLYLQGEYVPLELNDAVRISKIMLHRALGAGVDVIRIGLQADADMENDSVLAGPYHPAFRQLVEAELCYDLVVRLCGELDVASKATVFCAPTRISDVVGQKRGNLERLARERGVDVVAVRGEPSLSRLELVVEAGGCSRRGNILTDLRYGGGTLQ